MAGTRRRHATACPSCSSSHPLQLQEFCACALSDFLYKTRSSHFKNSITLQLLTQIRRSLIMVTEYTYNLHCGASIEVLSFPTGILGVSRWMQVGTLSDGHVV